MFGSAVCTGDWIARADTELADSVVEPNRGAVICLHTARLSCCRAHSKRGTHSPTAHTIPNHNVASKHGVLIVNPVKYPTFRSADSRCADTPNVPLTLALTQTLFQPAPNTRLWLRRCRPCQVFPQCYCVRGAQRASPLYVGINNKIKPSKLQHQPIRTSQFGAGTRGD